MDDMLKTVAKDINDSYVPLLNIAASYDSPFTKWLSIISVMVERKADNYQVNNLWTIHLFEANYNWLLGLIFGR
jgi:hypothetical protein